MNKRKVPLPVYPPGINKPVHELTEEDRTALHDQVIRSRIPLLIRVIREHRKMTQKDLSRACGLSTTYLSGLERGAYPQFPISTLSRVARGLGCCIYVGLVSYGTALEAEKLDDQPVIPLAFEEESLRSKLKAQGEEIERLKAGRRP